MSEGTLRADIDGDTLVLSGSVDPEGVSRMREEIAAHTRDHTRSLVVDLRDVDYLPSLGVGVLALAMRRCQRYGARLDLLVGQGSIVARVLLVARIPHTAVG